MVIPETGRIDTHTHLLPGIDDGCKTLAESMICARELVDAGYTHAFCTPHVWPDYPENRKADNLREKVRLLQAAYDAASVPLKLLPGGELNLLSCSELLADLPREEVITYGLLGRFVLFDFWTKSADDVRDRIFPAVDRLNRLGLQCMLAHPERIQVFHHSPGLIADLTARGVRLQMNTWCITEPAKSSVYQLAERLLKDGQYFMFGTDLHSPPGMSMRLDGLKVAGRMVGEAAVRTMTVEHPGLLLQQSSDYNRPCGAPIIK
jgi:protein-tyrosine phosphatase